MLLYASTLIHFMAQTRCGPGRSEAWGYTEEGPLLFSKSMRKRQNRTDNAGPGVLTYIARTECYTARCKASYFFSGGQSMQCKKGAKSQCISVQGRRAGTVRACRDADS